MVKEKVKDQFSVLNRQFSDLRAQPEKGMQMKAVHCRPRGPGWNPFRKQSHPGPLQMYLTLSKVYLAKIKDENMPRDVIYVQSLSEKII